MKNFKSLFLNSRLLLFLFLPLVYSTSCAQRDSLEFKIGQMIMIGFPGTTPDADVIQAIQAGKIGSVIFLKRIFPRPIHLPA